MTTIITRLYSDSDTAKAVHAALIARGHQARNIDMISGDGAAAKMKAAQVNSASAAAYAKKMSGDMALIVVRAPFTPIGTARSAMIIVDSHPSVKAGVANENEYITNVASGEHFQSILRDHPRFMTQDMTPTSNRRRGLVSEAFGVPLLSSRVPSRSSVISRMFFPRPLLTDYKTKRSVFAGGKLFSESIGLKTVTGRR